MRFPLQALLHRRAKPGGEFLCARDYNRYKDSLTKTIFKDEMKQLYDERQSLQDKLIESVKEKMSEFSADIGQAPDGFAKAFVDLKFALRGYRGRNNYQFISREQKEKVDAVAKIVCEDQNLQDLYGEWCRVQLALLKYYRKDPEECFDSLENNLNLQRRLENIVLRAAIYDNKKNDLYTDSIGTYMNKLLVQAVDCTIAGHVDRMVDMLYKLAVSIEKQNLISSGEYDDYYESYIEELSEENVKKRHGRL